MSVMRVEGMSKKSLFTLSHSISGFPSSHPDLAFLIVMMTLLIIVTQTTNYSMPIWGSFLAIGLAGATMLPIGVVLGITGTPMYINVLSQVIIGYLIPGSTIGKKINIYGFPSSWLSHIVSGVMCFKAFATNTGFQAITLIEDLKTGHYMSE